MFPIRYTQYCHRGGDKAAERTGYYHNTGYFTNHSSNVHLIEIGKYKYRQIDIGDLMYTERSGIREGSCERAVKVDER